jgi:signal transduction histidine kinase
MGRVLSTRMAHRLAWALAGASVGLAAVGLTLSVANWSTQLPPGMDEQGPFLALFSAFIPFSLVGALILYRRPDHRIGWLFSAMGLSFLIGGAAQQYGIYGLITRPKPLPGSIVLSWLANWILYPGLAGALLLLLVFPDGHLLSKRWIPLAVAVTLGVSLLAVGSAFAPGHLSVRTVRNPFAFKALSFLDENHNPGWIGFILAPIGGLVAIVIRFRRSKGDERRRLKLFAYAAGFLAVALSIISFASDPTTPAWALVLLAVAFAFVPIATGIGILRHSLYDIDLVISRAIVYAVLVALITAAYVGVVIGIGAIIGVGAFSGSEQNLVLSLVAAAVVALAFQPLRERARRLANRLVYGNRATPYEVLSGFSDRMGGSVATEDLLPEMARILGEGTGATRAEAWLRVGDELRLAASWPEADDDSKRQRAPIAEGELPVFPGADRAVAVRHQGELLGALTVTKPASEPLTSIEEKLLADLASQAGLVLRNARLTAELRQRLDQITAQAEELRRAAGELRASRQRLVRAQDEERRRLERNLHDGAQQQLVALAIKERLVENLIDRDPDKAREMLSELQTDTAGALDNLRELARGIYPPLLADQGLPEALRSQARKSPLPIHVDADGVGRFSQEAEAAVYFCVLEALQNVTKYSQASSVTIRLRADDGLLSFAVSDDGRGFDRETTKPGSGLTNMSDRMAALGGSLTIESAVGRGTVVSGQVPTDGA